MPSAANIPEGCRFHPRCLYAKPECMQGEDPELQEVENGHYVACIRYKEIEEMGK
ncbi:MAG TPA: hypothetical protein PKM10_02710 [Halanaerobiales bacterium]|nr:hypothetical protein [Halanaerobiales bacterium]HQD04260.1 hypothetical protein [Halanaerobiales bacterium]